MIRRAGPHSIDGAARVRFKAPWEWRARAHKWPIDWIGVALYDAYLPVRNGTERDRVAIIGFVTTVEHTVPAVKTNMVSKAYNKNYSQHNDAPSVLVWKAIAGTKGGRLVHVL